MKSQRAGSTILILAIAGIVGAGCGGVSGSHGVSPASFFLPGLIHHEVQKPRPDDAAPVPMEDGPAMASKPKPVAG